MRLQVGDKVDYHAKIGGEITSINHIIKRIQYVPNNFGIDVAWITEKSGCVALKALSRSKGKKCTNSFHQSLSQDLSPIRDRKSKNVCPDCGKNDALDEWIS